jgi:hypothetical protein
MFALQIPMAFVLAMALRHAMGACLSDFVVQVSSLRTHLNGLDSIFTDNFNRLGTMSNSHKSEIV